MAAKLDSRPAPSRGSEPDPSVVSMRDVREGRDETVKDLDRRGGDANRDAITGAPGSHPVGTGIGAAGAGAAGAAIGSLAGPVGTVVGAVVGAVAGGLAGKGIAESVNPTEEDAFWRGTYATRPYIPQGSGYDIYQPAYRFGWEAAERHQAREFDEVEPDLRRDWDADRGASANTLEWDRARNAARDSYERIRSRYNRPESADRGGTKRNID